MDALRFIAAVTPVSDQIFWEDAEQKLSYLDILMRLEQVRAAWPDVAPGSITTLEGFAPLEAWIHVLAALSLNVPVLPFAEHAQAATIDLALAQLPWSVRLQKTADASEPFRVIKRQAQKDHGPAVYIMTSGSTGTPKAIAHTLSSLVASARATLDFYGFESGESWLLSLDPSHIGGLQILFRMWLGHGRCVYGGEPKDVVPAIARFACDYLSLVPTQLFRALDDEAARAAMKKAKAVLLGGAATQDGLRDRIRELPVSITYGSSETASQISAFKPGQFPDAMGDVGELLPGWTLQSNDEHDLEIAGPALMLGFWHEGQWHEVSGGRYQLADKGMIQDGRLYLEGRRDQVFQVGGENLSPREILNRLEDLYPLADMSLLAKEDARYGHVPQLVLRSTQRPSPEPILRNLEGLPAVKRPREIWWLKSDDVGKLSKAHLTHLIADQSQQIQRIWVYEKI